MRIVRLGAVGGGLPQAFGRATYVSKGSGRGGHGTHRGVNPAQRLTLQSNGQVVQLVFRRGSTLPTAPKANSKITQFKDARRLRLRLRAPRSSRCLQLIPEEK